MNFTRLIIVLIALALAAALYVAVTESGSVLDVDEIEEQDEVRGNDPAHRRPPVRAAAKEEEGTEQAEVAHDIGVGAYIDVHVVTESGKGVAGREVCIMKTSDMTPAGYWSPLRTHTDIDGHGRFRRRDVLQRFERAELSAIVLGPSAASARANLARDDRGRLNDVTITIPDGMSFVIEFRESDQSPCIDELSVTASFDVDGQGIDGRTGHSFSATGRKRFALNCIPEWRRMKLEFDRLADGGTVAGQIIEFDRGDVGEDNKLVVNVLPIFAIQLRLEGAGKLKSGTLCAWQIEEGGIGYEITSGKTTIKEGGMIRIVPEQSDALEGIDTTSLTVSVGGVENRWIGTTPIGPISQRTIDLGVLTLVRCEPLLRGIVLDKHELPVRSAQIKVAFNSAKGKGDLTASSRADGSFVVLPNRVGSEVLSEISELKISSEKYETLVVRSGIERNGRYYLRLKPTIVLPLVNGANMPPDCLDQFWISCIRVNDANAEEDEFDPEIARHSTGSQSEIRWESLNRGTYRIRIQRGATGDIERDISVEVSGADDEIRLSPLKIEIPQKGEVVVRRDPAIEVVDFAVEHRGSMSRFDHAANESFPLHLSRSPDFRRWYSIDDGRSWFPFDFEKDGQEKLVLKANTAELESHTFQFPGLSYDGKRFRIFLRARRVFGESASSWVGDPIIATIKENGRCDLKVQPGSEFHLSTITILELRTQKKTHVRAMHFRNRLGLLKSADRSVRMNPQATQSILDACQ